MKPDDNVNILRTAVKQASAASEIQRQEYRIEVREPKIFSEWRCRVDEYARRSARQISRCPAVNHINRS